MRPIAPIVAARMTLGSGLARTTKKASPAPATQGRQDRGTPPSRQAPTSAASTTATLDPLTAERCDIPVRSMSSVSSCGVSDVSPMTSAGSRARASEGSGSTAVRIPERRCSAVASTHERSPTRRGGPRGLREATSGSARSSAGASMPTTSTRSCQPSSAKSPSPRTKTGACTSEVSPRAVTSSSRIVRKTWSGDSPPSSPVGRPRSGRGSMSTTPSARTIAPRSASSCTGPTCRRASCAADAPRTSVVATRASARTPGPSRRHDGWACRPR